MDISAPQFRESIIAMDGEIVRPRVRTPAAAVALTPSAGVLIHKDNSVDEYFFPPGILEQNGWLLVPIIIPIGFWDMDANNVLEIPHGLGADWDRIRSLSGIVRGDNGAEYYTFHTANVIGAAQIWWSQINNINITVLRLNGGIFDDTAFNDPAYNRGWLTLWLSH